MMPKLIVILNKVDMLPKENRGEIIMKKIEAFRKVFEKTKFGGSVQIVPVAAAVGADEQGKETMSTPCGLNIWIFAITV